MNLKRMISFMIAPVITLCTMTLLYADAATMSNRYVKYTCATGVSSSYTLSISTPTSANARDTIGAETRTEDSDNGIVKLYSGTSWRGTGFIVDDHVIATAAHNIFNEDGYFANLKVALYDTNGNETTTTLDVKEVHIHSAYVENLETSGYWAVAEYDYALLTVSSDLSDYVHYDLAILPPSANRTFKGNIYVTGIPQDLDHETVPTDCSTIYTGRGNLYTASTPYGDAMLHYDTDASNGNSGSPVYVKSQYIVGTADPVVLRSVVAIHTLGVADLSIQTNAGVRITSPIIDFYKSNANIGY